MGCRPLRGLRIVSCLVVSWGSAALHPRAGSPAEHLGWGARLYAVAALRGLRQIQFTTELCLNVEVAIHLKCFDFFRELKGLLYFVRCYLNFLAIDDLRESALRIP